MVLDPIPTGSGVRLRRLTQPADPPWRRTRPKKSAVASYGFGDASGSAFRAASKKAGGKKFHFQFGQWPVICTREESSNWREFTNLVDYIVELGMGGSLKDVELVMFTDNSTAEMAFYKGCSHSEKLDALVLRLRKLEMTTGLILHIIHVSGNRMIQSGVDGISQGDHYTGVMDGEDLMSFVPIHLSGFERSSTLKPWLKDVLSGHEATFLLPNGWFEDTNAEGTFVWAPASAAVDLVVERLGTARHKRPNSLHLVVFPWLMTGYWRKALLKAADCCCRIDSDTLWNMKTQFEPLLIFFCFPFLPHKTTTTTTTTAALPPLPPLTTGTYEGPYLILLVPCHLLHPLARREGNLPRRDWRNSYPVLTVLMNQKKKKKTM